MQIKCLLFKKFKKSTCQHAESKLQRPLWEEYKFALKKNKQKKGGGGTFP